MLTIAETIYPQECRQMEAIIAAIEAGDLASGRRLLAEAESGLGRLDVKPRQLQLELFLNAIKSRLCHARAENLYLVADEGQQIRMFNFMAEQFPVVRYAQEIANALFLTQLSAESSFVILDIGIGTGQQMANLVQRVASEHPHVKNISVIGIEPSGDSLAKAELRLLELGRDYGLELSFWGIQKTVEQLEPPDWLHLEAQLGAAHGQLLINASFALHHVHPLPFRTELFRRLKALHPSVFVIIEPYADFVEGNLMRRFRNAWHHYGLTFRAIDTIDTDEEEKSAVKRVFFGREMVDVLSEGARVEQFETAEMWTHRLAQAGFEITPVRNLVSSAFNSVIRIEERPSYLGFNASGHPIVSVICAS